MCILDRSRSLVSLLFWFWNGLFCQDATWHAFVTWLGQLLIFLYCFCTFITRNFNMKVRKPRRDFRLPTSDFGLPTSDFRLRTSDFGLPTSDFRLRTSDFRLPTSDFRLPTSDFRLPTSDFWLPTSEFQLQNLKHRSSTCSLFPRKSSQT